MGQWVITRSSSGGSGGGMADFVHPPAKDAVAIIAEKLQFPSPASSNKAKRRRSPTEATLTLEGIKNGAAAVSKRPSIKRVGAPEDLSTPTM